MKRCVVISNFVQVLYKIWEKLISILVETISKVLCNKITMATNRLLYCGSDVDLLPMLICQEVNDFVYIDFQPNVEYYQHPDGFINDMDKNLSKYFDVIDKITFGDKQITYLMTDKETKVYKELRFLINTKLPDALEDDYVRDIVKSCNMLYEHGYLAPSEVVELMKLDKWYAPVWWKTERECKETVKLGKNISDFTTDMSPRDIWKWTEDPIQYKEIYGTYSNWLNKQTSSIVYGILDMYKIGAIRAIKGSCKHFGLNYKILIREGFDKSGSECHMLEYVERRLRNQNTV